MDITPHLTEIHFYVNCNVSQHCEYQNNLIPLVLFTVQQEISNRLETYTEINNGSGRRGRK